ncbi:MAG: thioredoxin family protein, partial [Marinirhabdus sp.]|nr:thioredoxin family protein [Marinirhabdus sp.]
YIILASVVLGLFACKNTTKKSTMETTTEKAVMDSRGMNTEVEDTIDGGKMLLGKINRNGLTQAPYQEWFANSQEAHNLNTVAIEKMKPLLDGVQLKVFMGTWCEDSQREVPALYEILDATDFDYNNLEVVAVSHDKDTPASLEKGFDIEFVPTLIFIKNGDTLNRIVEYAHGTLEQDMLTILQGEDYTPAYAD